MDESERIERIERSLKIFMLLFRALTNNLGQELRDEARGTVLRALNEDTTKAILAKDEHFELELRRMADLLFG